MKAATTMLLETNGHMLIGRRTKHINARYFMLADRVASGEVEVEHFPMTHNIRLIFLQRSGFFARPQNWYTFIHWGMFVTIWAYPLLPFSMTHNRSLNFYGGAGSLLGHEVGTHSIFLRNQPFLVNSLSTPILLNNFKEEWRSVLHDAKKLNITLS